MKGTIKSKDDVSEVFNRGIRLKARDLTILVLCKESQHGRNGRVAFIAGKKNGNAVWRNKAKRRMRAIYKDLNLHHPNSDIVFLAKSGTNNAQYSDMLDSAKRAFSRQGLDI